MDNLAESLFSEMAAEYSRNANRLATGIGATVPMSYARARRRVLFFETLHRVAPHVSAELMTDDARMLIDQCSRDWEPVEKEQQEFHQALDQSLETGEDLYPLLERHVNSPVRAQFFQTRERLDRHIAAWQVKFHLTEDWLADAANTTLYVDHQLRGKGQSTTVPLLPGYTDLVPNLHEGREADSASPVERYHPLALNELKLADILSGWDGPFGAFHSRTETVEDAVQRLLPALASRLHFLLTVIVTEDMRMNNDVVLTHVYRKPTAFEWLVRYQVLGESKNAIAKADDINRPHLTREVNEATGRLA